MAAALIADDKRVSLNWKAPRENRPKSEVKLLLNLFTIAVTCIPRGGEITVEAGDGFYRLLARGRKACLPMRTAEVLTGEVTAEDIDAHKVQPYYTLRLIEETGLGLEIEQGEDEVVLKAAR